MSGHLFINTFSSCLYKLISFIWLLSSVMFLCESESHPVVSDPVTPTDCPWNSPGQNTRVDSLSLLQGIFPTQGVNQGLPHCRQILYQLSHKGSLRTLEWVASPFSSRSSRPRNWTGVSRIVGGFFTNWANREALCKKGAIQNLAVISDALQLSSVQLLSRVRLFATPWAAACQASLSITSSRSPPKPMSMESMMP